MINHKNMTSFTSNGGIKGLQRYGKHVSCTNSSIDKVLFPGGYATISGSPVTFHYYTQDYLGNNRAVIHGTTGAIEKTVAYYPFGAVIADLGTPTTGQPYKFGGKIQFKVTAQNLAVALTFLN